MSAARTLYHPLRHVWVRTREPMSKKTACSSHRILEIGITERGLEDVGDITSFQRPVALFERHDGGISNAQNDGTPVKRGDELLQIHFDGHSISSADELYHAVWETFSDHFSIVSPVTGKTVEAKSEQHTILKSLEEQGIDEQTVLMGIRTTEEEWEDINKQNCFVTESEYIEIIRKEPRGAFY